MSRAVGEQHDAVAQIDGLTRYIMKIKIVVSWLQKNSNCAIISENRELP